MVKGVLKIIDRAALAERIKVRYAPVVLAENRVGGAGGRLRDDLREGGGGRRQRAPVPAPASVMVDSVQHRLQVAVKYLAQDFACRRPCADLFQFGLRVWPAVPPEVRTVQQFAQWCNANPSKASFGSPGEGTPAHSRAR